MELETYLQVIKRRIWIIIITPLTAVLITLLFSSYLPWSYSATSKIRINLNPYSNPTYTEMIYADRVMNTYIEIAKSNSVMSALRERIGIDKDRPAKVEVAIIPDTEIIKITVEDQNRELAMVAANTLAAMLIEQNPVKSGRVYVIDPATLPGLPSTTDHLKRVALALILGGVTGIGLAFLFENLDPRLHTVQQIQEIVQIPVIGEIPNYRRKFSKKNRLVDQKSEDADVFKRIYVNILSKTSDKPIKTILVSSAQPEEGKSVVLSNLAYSMAGAGINVIAVDADLHRPNLHNYLILENNTGMINLLFDKQPLQQVIQASPMKNLRVITSGEIESRNHVYLPKDQVLKVFQQLRQLCDCVLVDSPACLGVSDAVMLASTVDAVILVVRPGFIQRTALEYTCRQFRDVNANMIGMVLNQVKETPFTGYARYYHSRRTPRARFTDRLRRVTQRFNQLFQPGESSNSSGTAPSPEDLDIQSNILWVQGKTEQAAIQPDRGAEK